jgi:conjugative transfer signal peptidase TraF
MTSTFLTLNAMTVAVAMTIATLGPKPTPWFVWNASGSVPIGLYSVRPTGTLYITDLVVAQPPEPIATFLADGRYLPRGVPLIKRVLALPGQEVCRKGLHIIINGLELGTAAERDRRGRPPPVWQGCRVVLPDQIFLMNWDEPSSLDGRYFGPMPFSSIVGRAQPLLDIRGPVSKPPICNSTAIDPCHLSVQDRCSDQKDNNGSLQRWREVCSSRPLHRPSPGLPPFRVG